MLSESHPENGSNQANAPIQSGELLGVPLALTDYREVTAEIDRMIAEEERGYICVTAVHSVMLCQEDPDFRRAVLGASYVLPDGQPLVWALNALGHEISERVYGPDMMAHYCAHAASTGTPMFLYGGQSEQALITLTQRLLHRFKGLKIAGGYSPPFRKLSEQEEQAVVERINNSGAKVVWVGIGVPKQELWMERMRERLTAPVLIGVGAAFDFHAGLTAQAPTWMQKNGLEWAFRLKQEPKRLLQRYLRYNPRFVVQATQQYLQQHKPARKRVR